MPNSRQPPQPIVDPPVLLYDTRNWDGVASVIANEGSAGSGWDLAITRALASPVGQGDVVFYWDGWAYEAELADVTGALGLGWADLGGTLSASPMTIMVYFGQHPYVEGELFGTPGVFNPGDELGTFDDSSHFRLSLAEGTGGGRPDLFVDIQARINSGALTDEPEGGGMANPNNRFFRWFFGSLNVRARLVATTVFSALRHNGLPAIASLVAHYDKPLTDSAGLATLTIDAAHGGLTYFSELLGRHHAVASDDPVFGDGALLDTEWPTSFGTVNVLSPRAHEPFAVQTVCAPLAVQANVSGNLSVDDSTFTALADDYAIIALSGRPTDTTVPATPSGFTLLGSVFNEHGAVDVGLAVWGKRLGAGEALPPISVPASWVSATGGSERYAIYTAAVWRGVDDTTAMDAAANTQSGDVTAPADIVHQLPTAVSDRARFVSIIAHDNSTGTGDVTEDWVEVFQNEGGFGGAGLQSRVQWRSIERTTDADPTFDVTVNLGTVPFVAVGIALRPAVDALALPGNGWQIVGIVMLRGEPTPADIFTWTDYFD